MVNVMRTIGLTLFIGGVILGIILGKEYGSWSLAFWIVVILNGILFIAISVMMESTQRIEDNLYHLSRAYFENNPNERPSQKPLGNSRSSLTKMMNYKMGQTED